MIATQSFGLLISAVAIAGFGILSQQPLVTAGGAGVAGGIGSANLVRSRRKDDERANLEHITTLQAEKLQTLERTVANLTARSTIVENLATTITDTQASVQQLERTSKVHTTQLNLQVKGIQKLQQVNYRCLSTIADRDKEISDKKREVSWFKNEIDELANLVNDRQAVSNPISPREPITHLLIDGNAMRFIEKEIGNIDYRALRQVLTKGTKNVKCKFYLAETGKATQQQFITKLKQIGFEVFLFPIVNLVGGKQQTKGDDVQIAIDAVSALPGDRVILCGGGDSDFFPVVNRLKDMGIDFTIVAHETTLGSRLKKAAGNNLIYFSKIQGIKLS